MEDKYKISFDEIRALLQENQYQQDDINSLEKAFEFAKKLHNGQFRISEEPYIIHPMEVVKILISLRADIHTLMAGFLHDILEDTDTTVDELKTLEYISDTVIDAVVTLTRTKEETYNEYIERVGNNRLATVVKLHDLKDNMDITRYTDFKDISLSLLERYHKAYNYLVKQLFKLENNSN